MRTRTHRVARYDVLVTGSPIVCTAVSVVLLAACGGAGGPTPADPAALARQANELAAALHEAAPVGGLRVQLAFRAGADLDLYVTDPLEETVYFANTPTRTGGELLADRRCGDAEVRVEEVVFREPLPGRYRVGVDYPKHCAGREETAAFAVTLRTSGLRREHTGSIAFQHFLPTVIEIDLAPSSPEAAGTSKP